MKSLMLVKKSLQLRFSRLSIIMHIFSKATEVEALSSKTHAEIQCDNVSGFCI